MPCACAQTRLAQSKQKTEVAKFSTELDLTSRSLKDAKQRFGALQVQHRKKELEYEKLQNHLRDLLCEKVRMSVLPLPIHFLRDRGTEQGQIFGRYRIIQRADDQHQNLQLTARHC
jgi:hypothetical protein